jgi:hypothetical protein
MPTVAEALYAHLAAVTAITNIVGTPNPRIHPAQGAATTLLPEIIYEVDDDIGYEHSAATSTERECSVTLKMYGPLHSELQTLQAAVRTAMQVKHALLGGSLRATVFNLGESQGAEFPVQGQNKAPYEFISNFSIQYTAA